MNPGISVTSPRSIIFAFAGTRTEPAGPTAVIVLSVTTTTALLIGAAPVPSIKRAAFNTTTPFPNGASGVMRGVCDNSKGANRQRTSMEAGSLYSFKVDPQQEIGIAVPNAAFT